MLRIWPVFVLNGLCCNRTAAPRQKAQGPPVVLQMKKQKTHTISVTRANCVECSVMTV